MFHKKERYCRTCAYSKYFDGPSVLASGYICKLKPCRPVMMGLEGNCNDRERNEKEQYSEEDS